MPSEAMTPKTITWDGCPVWNLPLTSAIEPTRYQSLHLLTASTIKIFSSEKTLAVEPCCLRYDSTFLDLSSLLVFMDFVRRCHGVLAYDFKPKSSCMAILTIDGSTSSSEAILRFEIVGSFATLALSAFKKPGILFLLAPPLPGFLWPLFIDFLTFRQSLNSHQLYQRCV